MKKKTALTVYKYNDLKLLCDGYRRISFENLSTTIHKHEDYYELILVTKSEWRNVTEKETMHLSTGSLILYKPGATHQLYAETTDSKHLVVCISKEYFEDFSSRTFPSFHFDSDIESISTSLTKEDAKYIEHLATRICQNTCAIQNAADKILFLSLSSLVSYSYTHGYDNYISDIIRKLDSYYYLNESVSEICSHYPYSQSLLLRRFKDLTGTTIVDYKAQQKLKYACQLLANTEGKIIDIATALKYSSLSHFLRRFKETYGMTPSEYREKYSKK
jgi:AraC-like DNA-binding protein